MEFFSGLYAQNEQLISDDKDLIMNEDCNFTIDTPITTPVINVPVASTQPAIASATHNSWETFSERISAEHLGMPSVCNNAHTEHVKQTRQEQQMVLYSAEHGRRTFSPSRPTQSKEANSKIPRPTNGFLVFANKWRRTLAMQYPLERNKAISVRLGVMWKSMNNEEKSVYMDIARELDAEHKRKYPGYVYSPKEARIQKALRVEGHNQRNLNKRRRRVTAALPSGSASEQVTQVQQSWDFHHQAFQPTDTSRQSPIPHSLLASRMITEQQRSLQETRSTIREQVEQGMIQGSTDTYMYIQL
jgi:hypothetical protein